MKLCKNCNNHFEVSGWQCPACGTEQLRKDGIVVFDPEIGMEDQELGFPQEAFNKLYANEGAHFWFRSRNRLITWAIDKYYSNADNLLEVGCGTGYVLQGIADAFPGIKLSGDDISVKGLSFASKRNSSADFIQFDATNMPYFEEFDLIGAFDVIEHIENDLQVLKEINKALVENGGVMLTVPQHQFLWSHADERACHKRRYQAKEVKELLAQSGFEVVRATSFITLLFPFMVFSRLISRNKKASEVDSAAELMLPKIINYLFERICDIERLLIKLGVNFPFGGSLLVVARKTKNLQ